MRRKSTATILAVDDEPHSLVALRALLTEDHYRIITAESGEQALRMLPEHDVDVILLDIKLPGLNGYETAQQIRQDQLLRGIPIIFVTAYYRDDADIARGYAVGASDYLIKPFPPQLLKSKITYLTQLGPRPQRDESARPLDQLQELSSSASEFPGRVMLLTADPLLRNQITESLRVQLPSVTTDTYHDTEAAMRRLVSTHYEALILDASAAPGESALLRYTREVAAVTPVILLTHDMSMPALGRALEIGVYDCLPKPVERHALAFVIRRAIETYRLKKTCLRSEHALETLALSLRAMTREDASDNLKSLVAKLLQLIDEQIADLRRHTG
ncbi:response regulator [Candidatus Nitrospira bockiana]